MGPGGVHHCPERANLTCPSWAPGAYVVPELACPGYIIDEAQRIIHLDPNEHAQFVFTNSVKPSLHLVKLSSDGSRMAGVTFRMPALRMAVITWTGPPIPT